MKRTCFLLPGLLLAAPLLAQIPRVGVGTTTPRAGLDVSHNDGLVATGTFDVGTTGNLPTGAGTRLLWIPKKAAFRVGYADGNEWDYANVGAFSTATGLQTIAGGYTATAMGNSTDASGSGATALGTRTTASGNFSTALGWRTTASGEGAVAMGLSTTASGYGAVAMGSGTTASALMTLAMGYRTTASGIKSVAMGSFANTNEKAGSFALGDNSTTTNLLSQADYEFSARFAGGYRLFTNTNMTVGVSLASGGNAWQTISDSTKKEGFRPADGADFLRKIASMRLGSWNYRGQDARTMRHYGPMAQDFFAAFGHDGVGTIGTDTTLNGADFDGINLIAIQALVRENEAIQAHLNALETECTRADDENEALFRRLERLEARLGALETRPTTPETFR